MNYIKTSKILTYLGVIPFIALSLGWLLSYETTDAFNLYAVLILSFLGGINWGIGLINKNSKIIAYSVLPAIIGWLLYLLASIQIFMMGMIILFLIQLSADFKISRLGFYENWFFKLRTRATSLVILSLIFAIIGLES
jgi:hypothetical protein